MKTPETLDSNNDSTKEPLSELDELENEIISTPEKKKFEILSKDPAVKSGLDKLYNGVCLKAFSEEWKTFENMNIGEKMSEMLNKYPSLRLVISGDLGLPLSETKFSNLSLQQKLNFTSLYRSIYGTSFFYKKNPSAQDINNRIIKNNATILNKINRQFELENIKNRLKIENTLNSFGLNEKEIKMVIEYLKIIKKHPEFIGDKIYAGGIGGYIFAVLFGIVVGAVGMHYYDNMGKIEHETTTTLNGVTEIKDVEKIFRLLTQQANFKKSGSREIKMFSEDKDDWTITSIVKEWTNKIQSKQIEMELSGKIAMQFDLQNRGCKMYISSKDGKGEVYVLLPQPDVIVTSSKAKILSENREWVHLRDFDQTQEGLRQELEETVKTDAKNDPNFYERGKKEIEQQLYDLFLVLRPEGIDIERVHVQFFNPKNENPIINFQDGHPINWPMPVETGKKE